MRFLPIRTLHHAFSADRQIDLLLDEPITLRYLFASIAVLGGIALVVIEKQRAA
jgi:drug/metabolite transporter (DMT)-like permease